MRSRMILAVLARAGVLIRGHPIDLLVLARGVIARVFGLRFASPDLHYSLLCALHFFKPVQSSKL